MDTTTEKILRRRMHGLYLSRRCADITELSQALMGLHCWFHRNVAFSALIRGADLADWQTALVKTWLYRGTLHGVAPQDLPTLLALHARGFRWGEPYRTIAERAVALMEDGIYSRAEMRLIFADEYDRRVIERALSPWGGVFCELAANGRVAFRDMTSRDFDLIDAVPTQSAAEVLPGLFRRFLTAYGPATLADAAWFLGLGRERKQELTALDLDEYRQFEVGKSVYYDIAEPSSMADIPRLTLLSGFDPIIVSYQERGAALPPEYKRAVIMKSGICLPTVAVDGQIAGLWNLKKGKPFLEFFTPQPKKLHDAAMARVEEISWRTNGRLL